MLDIKKTIPLNSYLIFPYEVYGGGVSLALNPDDKYIEKINTISIPLTKTEQEHAYYYQTIIDTSQDILLATLLSIFTSAELHKNVTYPFITIPKTQSIYVVRI